MYTQTLTLLVKVTIQLVLVSSASLYSKIIQKFMIIKKEVIEGNEYTYLFLSKKGSITLIPKSIFITFAVNNP